MESGAGKHWTEEEVKALLSVWSEKNIRKQLHGTLRNKGIFIYIAKRLQELGVCRDWKQCRAKYKNLKYEYRTVKYAHNSGDATKTMKFFHDLDAILRYEPVTQLAAEENGRCSATEPQLHTSPTTDTTQGCYDGLVYVLQSSDGEVHWTFATEDAVKSSAVVDPSSGVAYIGSHDQHVYALDIYQKACVWKVHCNSGAVFSSPCLSSSPHHLYVATLGGLLLAVNPVTGNTIWKSSLGKALFSSPHCNEQCVCVGCVDGNLYCYTHAGEKAWQLATGGPVFSSPCISSLTKQEVFVGSHDCFIYCCSTEGTLLWKFKATASVYGAPFVFQSDGLQSRILLAAVSTDGRVWILNAKSGRAEGAHKLPGEVFSSPVVWGTKLLVGCRNDYVYCLDVCTAGGKNS